MSSACVIIPLHSALGYAIASLLLKRALQHGVGPWRMAFVANLAMGLLYQPLWMWADHPFAAPDAARAAVAGFTFFLGQICTFIALDRGDVSVATPLLGTKVIFVAVFTLGLLGEHIRPAWWIAVGLTAAGTILLGWQPGRHPQHVAISIGSALGAAISFALTDVLVQKWAPAWGAGSFIPTMFATVTLLSFSIVPLFRGSLLNLPPVAWRWLAAGAVLLALQALGMAVAISVYGHATVVNIAYNSRGLWSIVLVWTVGHWFRNIEREQGRGVMIQRMAACLLLLGAIFLVSLR